MPTKHNATPPGPREEQPEANPNPPLVEPGLLATLCPASAKPCAKAEQQPSSNKPRECVPLDEALREAGLDARKYAEKMGVFIDRVSEEKGQEKLLLDGLKEWGRRIETPRVPDRPGANDAPIPVLLVHNVPRPGRTGNGENEK